MYALVRQHFNAQQLVDLVMTINTIKSWNRLNIATGMTLPRPVGWGMAGC
jgi:alkylhydroperoxidase family enzyme